MKVAIVHYWFINRRGGEKVIESLLKLYPEADIYTLFYDKKQYGNYISEHKIYTSNLDKAFLRKYYQMLFPLYPFAIKSLKLHEKYDLIISSESGPAKGIQNPSKIPHISYVHTPMRYCWGGRQSYLQSVNIFIRPILNYFLERLKKWDASTITNVDLYVANSLNVKNRIKTFYNKEAVIIHPPIEEELFKKPLKILSKEVYLSFGALVPYKKIELLVDTFNDSGKPLVIIGEGSEKQKLVKKAKSNITFKPYLNWSEIEKYILQSRALLFPGEEDFGMIPLELMSYGVPVIAYGKGGALETVIENKADFSKATGLFFQSQTVSSLEYCINEFEKHEEEFNQSFIRNHAHKFVESVFLQKMKTTIQEFLGKQ